MNTHLGMCQIFARGPGRGAVAALGCALLHGLHWDTEVGKDAITRAINMAKPAGVRVVFDVADPFAVERYRADFLVLIREHVAMGVLKTGKDGSIAANGDVACRSI